MSTTDPFVQFKAAQRQGWGFFLPLTTFTTTAAASLVEFAGVRAGEVLLDVACGTGVVAVTATRSGAQVRGLDLSPILLEEARRSAALIGAEIEFGEGDVETMPYADASFDVVLSQFGHMFAPRSKVAATEMLRVIKPGGRIAFSTWPPELLMARVFEVAGNYNPVPPGAAAPSAWGEPNFVREQLGGIVTDVDFLRGETWVAALSPQHYRASMELSVAPVINVVEQLHNEPRRLAKFRAELDAIIEPEFSKNRVRLSFLMTRAIKR